MRGVLGAVAVRVLLVFLLAVFSVAAIVYRFVPSDSEFSREDPVYVRIANLPVVQGLPLYLALARGYFDEVDLKIEVTRFEAPNQIVDALLSSNVDFVSPSGAMGILGVASFRRPGKLKIYSAAGGSSLVQNDAILVRRDSEFTALEDLKGKRFGILPGIQWRTIAKHIFAQMDIDVEGDLTLVELAPALQVPALASGEIDALLGVEPMPTVAKKKGIARELISKATVELGVSDPFYAGAGAFRVEFEERHPEVVAKVLAVLRRAIEDLRRDPSAARQYLKGNTPLDDALIAEVPICIFKMYDELEQRDLDAIQKFYDIFSTYGVINGKMNFRDILYSPVPPR